MFSKEDSRKLREEFWISFGKSFPRKWILYDTKLKGFAFKFHFDTKSAMVTLDLEDDLENRIKYWDKLQSLKAILTDEFLPEALFEETYFLDNGKEISRIYIPLDEKVSIHNKNSWRTVMEFFVEKMTLFESFFEDYKDFIDS
ncbi:uncharacterized protein DUF4268 [Gelidibacter sediminis]|uniref:Uncharacterized protein DUF4268 n=1 Tax=Gelidibacter sediminis TaxID=1608710 RepID=A0A4R7Q0Z3_9FLAO|nr:DUF4268 domain-containing protein [Gelidibacter sediminis]TDU40269.1 uncharacterized protein DUF4268 [Gelidibacter sediminis]